MIIVFSYNREKMLLTLLEELKIKYSKERVIVIDDGSTYNPKPMLNLCEYYRLNHKGKNEFYLNWMYAFSICEQSDDDFFMFLPDDFTFIDKARIDHIYKNTDTMFAYNLLNDGRPPCWTPIVPHNTTVAGVESIQTSYVDCGYFTNRKTLKQIQFVQDYVHPDRFLIPDISSGVGYTQSRKYYLFNIPMYIPKSSMCYHGRHDSIMHLQLRKKQPLVSQ